MAADIWPKRRRQVEGEALPDFFRDFPQRGRTRTGLQDLRTQQFRPLQGNFPGAPLLLEFMGAAARS